MRVEGGESIQADCDCWTDSESPSLARSPLARQASWPLPQSLRLLHPRIVEGLSLSLLVVCKFVRFDLPDREAGTSGFPRVGESGDSWRFPTSRRVLLCWQYLFASLARWPRSCRSRI
jgi:hypothetical protein